MEICQRKERQEDDSDRTKERGRESGGHAVTGGREVEGDKVMREGMDECRAET